MEGFILAAGLGTRLRPLTDNRPKALVEVQGKPLLQIAIDKMCTAGISHIVVNVHHMAQMVVDYLRSRQWRCTIDISDESRQLLDTGGGLKHAAPLFSGNDDIVIHNVDILSDIDLIELQRHHTAQGNLATLCVSHRATSRLLAFRDGLLVDRWHEDLESCQPLAFSGVSVVSPDLLPLLPLADHPYPIIDQYIALGKSNRIGSYIHPAEHWLDVGKPDTLKQARQWTLS